jgi:tryptophanyl-tRNA synthetase
MTPPLNEKFNRVLSGMRPTGDLHLGHYHGVLKNWVKLQHEYDCFFFVADWHALTTHYDESDSIRDSATNMVIDWLAAGIKPSNATIFLQSRVLEHAELFTLLSMVTPLSWLERVPTYKDQQEKLKGKDLSTYGFLGYPLLQSADILVYQAGLVPVGEDQVAHLELTREVARRFNFIYGRETGFEAKAEAAAKKMGKKNAKLYHRLRTEYQEQGNQEALETARAFLHEQQNLTVHDTERLLGYLDGGGKTILPEPEALLTPAAKMPGLDGQKMSKSYNNTISLRESPDSAATKIRTMPTDPARVRRTDPGNPERCPVWQYHQIYSSADTRAEISAGCQSAGIGCIDCKQHIMQAVSEELDTLQQRAQPYRDDPKKIRQILEEGAETAQRQASQTMEEVRQAIGLGCS